MRKLDLFLIAQARKLVVFLDEWCSLSQSNLERFLIVLSVASDSSAILLSHILGTLIPIWVDCFVWFFNVLYLVIFHRMPQASRKYQLETGRGMRMMFFFGFWLFGVPTFLRFYERADVGPSFVYQIATVLFVFVVVSFPDSEPGRRRRLALSKLREIFGPLWTPVPEEAR